MSTRFLTILPLLGCAELEVAHGPVHDVPVYATDSGMTDMGESPHTCPVGAELHFSGPLVAANGCTATLYAVSTLDEDGRITGDMWLEDVHGGCQPIVATIDAQVSAQGTLKGTVQGPFSIDVSARVLDGCQDVTDGWFRVPQWAGGSLAQFQLERTDEAGLE